MGSSLGAPQAGISHPGSRCSSSRPGLSIESLLYYPLTHGEMILTFHIQSRHCPTPVWAYHHQILSCFLSRTFHIYSDHFVNYQAYPIHIHTERLDLREEPNLKSKNLRKNSSAKFEFEVSVWVSDWLLVSILSSCCKICKSLGIFWAIGRSFIPMTCMGGLLGSFRMEGAPRKTEQRSEAWDFQSNPVTSEKEGWTGDWVNEQWNLCVEAPIKILQVQSLKLTGWWIALHARGWCTPTAWGWGLLHMGPLWTSP